MVIRSFTADSVASALKQVRSELGGEAVVLKTRMVDGKFGRQAYEVTACLDSEPNTSEIDSAMTAEAELTASVETMSSRVDLSDLIQPEHFAASIDHDRLAAIENKLELIAQASRLAPYGLSFGQTALSEAAEAMQSADVPLSFVRDFIAELRRDSELAALDHADIRDKLKARLDGLIDHKFGLRKGDRAVVLGLAGAGKTSVLGRLAAELTLKKKTKVKLITLDNSKVGALDEFASYGDLLGIEDVVTSPSDAHHTNANDSDKVTLIDTAALPTNTVRLTELKENINRLTPTHRLLVCSALTRSTDISDLVNRIAWFKPTHIAITHTDLTGRIGGLLAAANGSRAKVALITGSPSGADLCQKPQSEKLADILINGEVNRG